MDRLHAPRGEVKFSAMRCDAGRDTRILVSRNANGHPHIQIGGNVTLILHPHAAKRLIAGLQEIEAGEDFVRA